jgi:hypothetical protein
MLLYKRAYSQILDGTLRDATALSSSSATINSTRALEAALTSTQVHHTTLTALFDNIEMS